MSSHWNTWPNLENLEPRLMLTANFVPGDCNGDSVVNGQDIYGFIQALSGNAATYQAADANRDFLYNGQDIFPFLQALSRRTPAPGSVNAIPPAYPAGEKALIGDYRELAAGARDARYWLDSDNGVIWHYATSDSVGDGSAEVIYAEPGTKVGWITSYDIGVQGADFTNNLGLCLWMKGDGSDATAVFSTGYEHSNYYFRVSMKDTSWHKVFMPWGQWQQPLTGSFWYLTYSIERSDPTKTNWFAVDKIAMYSSEFTEAITPTANLDPVGDVIANQLVSGRQYIANTIQKLENRQPVKIVVAGDSIVNGAQLGYAMTNYAATNSQLKYIYFPVLTDMLKDYYGYTSSAWFLHSSDAAGTNWTDTPARVTGDLTVMSVGTGGWQTDKGLATIDQILNEHPDMVIWEYGANDGVYGTATNYVNNTRAAINQLKAAGIEVILQTVTPGDDFSPRSYWANKSPVQKTVELNVQARSLAASLNVAVADMEKAFLYRGTPFLGDLYFDNVHPNHVGHHFMAEVLNALITDQTRLIWDFGPMSASHAVPFRQIGPIGAVPPTPAPSAAAALLQQDSVLLPAPGMVLPQASSMPADVLTVYTEEEYPSDLLADSSSRPLSVDAEDSADLPEDLLSDCATTMNLLNA